MDNVNEVNMSEVNKVGNEAVDEIKDNKEMTDEIKDDKEIKEEVNEFVKSAFG